MAEGGDAAALGEAVSVRVLGGGEGGVDAAEGVGGRDVVHEADAGELGGVPLGVVEEGGGDRREGGETDRRAFVAELGDAEAGVEVGERDVGGAGVKAADEGEDGAHVEEGQGIPEAVLGGEAEAVAAGVDRRSHEGLVGEGTALGVGGGAGGVHHHGDVAEADAGAEEVDLVVGHAFGGSLENGAVEHPGGMRSIRARFARSLDCFALAPQQHDALQLRGAGEGEGGGVGGLGEAGEAAVQQLDEVDVLVDEVAGDEELEVGVLDDVGELVLLVAGVDGHDPGAEHGGAEDDLDVVHAVGHEDADVVAGAEAEPSEGAGGADGGLVEAGVGVAPVGEDDGVGIGVAGGGADGEVAKGDDLGPLGRGSGFTHVGLLRAQRLSNSRWSS